MQRGDILLYDGRGFVAYMIKRVTNSRWSHAAWILDEGHVLESDWELFGQKGVQVDLVSDYEPDRRVILRVKAPVECVQAAVSVAESKIGKKYDFKLFFWLFWRWLKCACAFWRKDPVRDSNRAWICSELIAEPLYQVCGFRFVDDVPVGNVVPEDLWRAVELGRAERVE